MKKTLILYLVIVILFVMTGCDNEKTSNQEVYEWDSTYTCGELKLSLKKLDTLVEQYSILLKTKDCKYSGVGYSYTHERLNGAYQEHIKDIIFDDVYAYRCNSHIIVAKNLTETEYYPYDFLKDIQISLNNVLDEYKNNEQVYLRYEYSGALHTNFIGVRISVYSFDEQKAKDTFYDAVEKIKKIVLEYKVEYPMYIPDDLDILADEGINDDCTYTNNVICVVLDDDNNTFTFSGLLK